MTATFAGSVAGSITAVRAVYAKAVLPDEISGPALAVGVRIVNGSGRGIHLADAVVTLAYGTSHAPGVPMSGPPSSPLPAELAAGRSASGTYVFRVNGVGTGTPLVVSVSYSPTAPRVDFTGTR